MVDGGVSLARPLSSAPAGDALVQYLKVETMSLKGREVLENISASQINDNKEICVDLNKIQISIATSAKAKGLPLSLTFSISISQKNLSIDK